MSEEDGASAATPRRDFLGIAITGTGAALGLVSTYPVVRFVSHHARKSHLSAVAGTLGDFGPGSGKVVMLGDQPALIIRLPDGTFHGFSALCTHLECVVHYSAERNRIECPCHRGVYSVDGKNVSGPPPRPLTPLRVEVMDDAVVVSTA